MSPSQAIVIAPATTANLGPGFDVFGLALKQPHDKVTLTAIPKGVKIEVAGLWAKAVPLPRKNTASTVANHIIKEFDLKTGVHVKIDRNIMPGVGLGSSAASAAAVACGLNYLFNLRLDSKGLVRFAAKGERASAGYGHADNVSAAIYGGFTIVRSYDPLEIVNIKAPSNMEVCVAHPHIETSTHKTKDARKVVPKQVPIGKVVHNVGSAAAIASGFASGDVDLIGKSMSDAIVEPARAALIPAYHKVKEEALKTGACGVAISGAGPAMIAIVNRNKAKTSKVMKAMKAAFESAGLKATAFATAPGRGTYVLEMEK
jgi:homoserine kinase